MHGLAVALGTLLIAFVAHLVFWRLHLPKAQLKALILIFFLVWLIAALSLLTGTINVFSQTGGLLLGIIYFSLIYWSAALSYIITYSAMEGDSPTLSLTRHLHRRGEKGVSHSEIDDFFRQRPFIGARVRALVSDRILIEESGGYRLRSGKYLFFHTILLYRRIVFGPVKAGG